MTGELEPVRPQTEKLTQLEEYDTERLQKIAELEAQGKVDESITPESALKDVTRHLEYKLLILGGVLPLMPPPPPFPKRAYKTVERLDLSLIVQSWFIENIGSPKKLL